MELALNNFEVLDQTQMQEIDGDGVIGTALFLGGSACATISYCTGSSAWGIASVALYTASYFCDKKGW